MPSVGKTPLFIPHPDPLKLWAVLVDKIRKPCAVALVRRAQKHYDFSYPSDKAALRTN